MYACVFGFAGTLRRFSSLASPHRRISPGIGSMADMTVWNEVAAKGKQQGEMIVNDVDFLFPFQEICGVCLLYQLPPAKYTQIAVNSSSIK